MTINVPLHDAIFILQDLQTLFVLTAVGIAGFYIITKKKFTYKVKVSLVVLVGIGILLATSVCVLNTYDYFHNDRPADERYNHQQQ